MLGEVEEGGARGIGEDGWYLTVKRMVHLLIIKINLINLVNLSRVLNPALWSVRVCAVARQVTSSLNQSSVVSVTFLRRAASNEPVAVSKALTASAVDGDGYDILTNSVELSARCSQMHDQ